MAAEAPVFIRPTVRPAPNAAQRFLRHPLALSGGGLVLLLVLLALLALLLGKHAPGQRFADPKMIWPNGTDAVGVPHPPGGGFLMGADTLGRDVWTRLLFGAQISLTVAVCSVLTSTF